MSQLVGHMTAISFTRDVGPVPFLADFLECPSGAITYRGAIKKELKHCQRRSLSMGISWSFQEKDGR